MSSSNSSSGGSGTSTSSRYTKERLYELIPAIYRQHDAKLGKPLEAIIQVIAEQVEVLEHDIDTLYHNWFIETCEEWLVPYIGDLVGTKLLRSVEGTSISHRAWVANTIRYRSRKGTAFVIEQIAKDVTNWDARVVEFFRLLATTQNINHLRLDNIRTADIRNTERLELLDTPFDTMSHTADVRNIRSKRGYHNISNIGVFLWRIKSYPVINALAFPHGEGRYSFSQLGMNIQLFNNPLPEGRGDGDDIKHIAEEINVPSPIRRLALSKRLKDQYYGKERSILIMTKSNNDDSAITEVNHEMVKVCNLSNWNNRPSGKVAIDPVLGRIAFPVDEETDEVYVNYYYGFSSDLGGGFYDREDLSDDVKAKLHLDLPKDLLEGEEGSIINVSKEKPFSQALQDWETGGRKSTIFKITNSSMFYTEAIAFTGERAIPENTTLVIRSEDRQRAVLRTPFGSDSDLHMEIAGNKGSKLILEGLMFDKSMNIRIKSGDLSYLCINHCTLVPGEKISLQLERENNNNDNADNNNNNNNLTAVIYRSICGKISVANSGTRLMVVDSIVDGKQQPFGNSGSNGGSSENDNSDDISIECNKAIIERSTIFGKVNANLLELASNAIFTDVVTAKRRQEGCVRFSFVPTGSETPQRYRCQPAPSLGKIGSSAELRPRFTSERYGDAGYAQLHKDSPPVIFEGADNEAEMGVFNNLYQPQRIRNLESSLDEYLRFGLEAGILLLDANEAGGL